MLKASCIRIHLCTHLPELIVGGFYRVLIPNITYLQAFPMYKDLGYRSTSDIDIFYLLWSNVFSLCKLKYILLPINDLQCSILEVKGRGH